MASPAARRPYRPSRRRWRTVILLVLAVGGVGGIVIVLFPLGGLEWFRAATAEESVGPAFNSVPFNYRFALPPKPWELDNRTKTDLKANLVVKRSGPLAWAAVIARDYKTRTPRDAELLDEGIARISVYFKGLEWEPKPDSELAGKKAQTVLFKGEIGQNALVIGECLTMASQGVAYWFLTWTPEDQFDGAAEEWPTVRHRFTLGRQREAWTEKRPRILTAQGTKIPFSLKYPDDLWTKRQAADYDANADVALHGTDKLEARDVDKTATVLALVLEKQETLKLAAAKARAYLEAQQKMVYPETTIEPANDRPGPQERPGEVGNQHGQIARFIDRNAEDRTRFVLLAVVNANDAVVAIQCECDWKRRTLWERDFTQLLSTFQLQQPHD